ncbi:AarF/ABC1/UbiB kinase family protein [Candidatus Woesearchaeota archaeon]|nr:AarF/ABC1/UbiB kinase family protein [Candidatus Woesearchaeota archaeon]MBW3022221.1 AarF/ABC1/UbiB kinase family protein [Candidatus Woesearchaeota archaeon]
MSKKRKMAVIDLIRNFHDLKRLEEILVVFAEEGFGILIDKIKLSKHVSLGKRLKSKIRSKNNAPVRLRKAFERLGPTFIKFGQILSLRPDLIPYEYVLEFEKMQDKVPEFSFNQVESMITKELGSISKNFKSFDKKPIASASISQVHKAVLKNNNKSVAVKVKRPNVEGIMKTDIRILEHIAKLIDHHVPELRKYRLPKIVEEFSSWTARELDFKIEAANSKRFRNNLKYQKDIIIPKIYRDTKNVLVMDYIEGIPLHEIQTIKKKYGDIHALVYKGYRCILRQIFEDGFYHADPHPGNWLILKGAKIGLLDFGIVGVFNEDLKKISIDIFMGLIDNDPHKIARAFMKFGVSKRFDESEFKQDLTELFESMYYSDIREIEVSGVLENAINIARKYGIRIPRDYVLFAKTIVTLEGIALKYDPKFKFIAMSRPILKNIVMKRYSPKNVGKAFKKTAEEYADLFMEFPSRTSKFLDSISKGALAIDIEDKDVSSFGAELEHSAGNIALGLIVAALIVGASWVMEFPSQFRILNISWVSFTGYAIAAVIGIWVVRRTIFYRVKR